MPFFVIESEFTRPFDSFGAAITAHRTYLDQGYAAGLLLCSGPKPDGSGGILIARADDEAHLHSFLAQEPYQLQGLARYQIKAFAAVKQHPALSGF